MQYIAIILAGGIGSRLGGNKPKQLMPLDDGRSILEHTVDAFEQAACIDEIAIVMHPEWLEEAKKMVERNSWRKVKKIIEGGNERWESSWHAVQAYKERKDAALLLHDAARPFVSQTIIANTCKALETYQAVTVAIPSTDTIYLTENNKLVAMPDRSTVLRAQTPQAFHLGIIRKAFENALAQGNIAATDDVGIVHRYLPQTSIFMVPGDEANKKITYIEDLKHN